MLYRMLLLFFFCTACQPAATDPQPQSGCIPNYGTGCRPVIQLKGPAPTRVFVGDAHLDGLTRYLAEQERVESEQVGFSGSFSEVYLVYAQLREQASLEQLRLLLQHESPNVRYYALLGLASRDLEHKDSYYQQLGGKYDNLEYLSGCVGGSGELGEYVHYQIFEEND
jgi:hypothetical protein